MRIFRKIKKIEAQHTIEYAILLTLIMAGIIIAGPYVIRSWNANLKGWDDSFRDSLQDPLLEDDDLPMKGCDPLGWESRGCNGGVFDPCTGGGFSCSATSRLWEQPFDFPGCQCEELPEIGFIPTSDYLRCVSDNTCCTAWVPGACGVAGTPCADGSRYETRACGGTGGTTTRCVVDPTCGFICTSPPTPPFDAPAYGPMCAGDATGLAADTQFSFVAYSATADANCTATKCEVQCGDGHSPTGTGASAVCAPCITGFGIDTTGCAANQYNDGGCPSGQYIPCCIDPLNQGCSGCPNGVTTMACFGMMDVPMHSYCTLLPGQQGRFSLPFVPGWSAWSSPNQCTGYPPVNTGALCQISALGGMLIFDYSWEIQ